MLQASDFGTGQVFWSMLGFFLFFIWIWLLIVVFGDIVRSHDLGGWAKALWTIFVIVPSVTAAYSARQSSSRPRPKRCPKSRDRSSSPRQAGRQNLGRTVADLQAGAGRLRTPTG